VREDSIQWGAEIRFRCESVGFCDVIESIHPNALDQDDAFISKVRDGQIAELWEAWTEGPA
jgi:hypothetical protein